MERVGEAEAHFRVRKTNGQRSRRDHSSTETSSAVERSVRRGNCFQISTGRGCKRATHPIYRSEFMWGAVRVKEMEGEKQRGESGPFSLSCHWGSQLCNKACWVLIRLCGFGQERKNTPPVMTWHLLPDSHWGRTKSWTKLSSEATEPHSCDRPPGCEHLRKDEGSWGDWDHGKAKRLLLGTQVLL